MEDIARLSATQAVEGLLRRFPLLIAPDENRTIEEVKLQMVEARLISQNHGAIAVSVTVEQLGQSGV